MSYMIQVAEMLGVELKEEFEVIEPNSKTIGKLKYYFTEEGLYSDTFTVGGCYPLVLNELLNGKMKIYRRTYRNDFLEKFPKCSPEYDHVEHLCIHNAYGIGIYCFEVDYKCDKCWNRVFE